MALKGYELELDSQLRDELLRFIHLPANNHQTTNQKLTLAEIDRDGILHWIKRYLIQGQYQNSILVAQTILMLSTESYGAPILSKTNQKARISLEHEEYAREIIKSADSLFWGQLLTYYSEALIYSSPFDEEIDQMLHQAFALLNTPDILIGYGGSLNWLRERVLGRLHDRWGYLYRSNGHYGVALSEYKTALHEYKKTSILDEQATTMNNLAFILAILGDFEGAKTHADEALGLRQRIGQNYPMALSYNTRGLIYSLQGQHDLGRRDCQLALNKFEELEMPRGIGLACNAIGYTLRKQGEAWKSGQITTIQAVQSFQQSVKFLERATYVFDKQVLEPIRLWESYNEQGSLSREWGYLLNDQKEEARAQELYSKSIEYQLKALDVAQQYKMRFQEADTYDDMAKAFHDQGDVKKAKRSLKQALSTVPKEYVVTPKERNRKIPASGEAYWLILGKAHLQEGLWALQFITKSRLSSRKHQEYTQSVITNFTLAAYYFEHYWPDTSIGRARLQLMVDQIRALALSKQEVKRAVRQVAARYSITAKAFLNTFDN